MKKRIAALLLTLAMLVTFMPAMTFSAFAEDAGGSEDGILSFTISETEYTYDGTDKKPEVSNVSIWYFGRHDVSDTIPENPEIGDRYYTVDYKDYTNAGTATVTVTVWKYRLLVGWSWGWSDFMTYTIKKANPFVTEPKATNPTYNGKSQALLTDPEVVNDDIWVSYSLDDGKTWVEYIPTGKAVGEYNVVIAAGDGKNTDNANYLYNDTVVSTISEYKPSPAPTPDPEDPDKELKEAKAAAEKAVKESVAEEELVGEVKMVYEKAVEVINAADTLEKVDAAKALYVQMMGTTKAVNAVKVVQLNPVRKKTGTILVNFEKAELIAADDATVASVKYTVKRATNSKFTKNVKTYTKKSGESDKVTFVNSKNLKKGKRYYYKIRGAVTFTDGTVVHTKWSKWRSKVAKKTK